MTTFTRKSRTMLNDFDFFSVVEDTVHESTQNKEFTRLTVAHIGAVAVVPVMDNGDIVLIRQYRNTIDEYSLETVAGRRDVENEDVVQCALRELKEEVGVTATSIASLGWIHTSPGFTDERIYLFMATGCAELKEAQPDGIEEQLSEKVHCTISEALEWINDGTITDGKSIVNIYRLARALGAVTTTP